MSAFAAATASLFGDLNMAEAARYLPAGGGAGVACRVIQRQIDPLLDAGAHHLRQPGLVCLVRASDVPSPTRGARLEIAGAAREIIDVQPEDAGATFWLSVR